MARILISGASGFVGKSLSSFLAARAHELVFLPRDVAAHSDFEGFDLCIHLAGEPLTLARWSQQKRKKILDSRVASTLFLSHTFSKLQVPPKLLICASAFGYYGDRADEVLVETSSGGSGFLASVCRSWERATYELEKRGVRVVHARFGLVLGPHGGLLERMILPYKLGLGGRLGSGRQWMSWIALDDLCRAIEHVMQHESFRGAVNMVSPNPIRQEEFAQILADILHRPHFISTPKWLLHLCFGQTADELLLSSARVEPAKLLASNFRFDYPDLRSALCRAIQTI